MDNNYRCPQCGSKELILNEETQKLKCAHCGVELEYKETNNDSKIDEGLKELDKDSSKIVTLKCDGCGAEIVADLSTIEEVRCVWCRNIMTINSNTTQGLASASILPFNISKEEAVQRILAYSNKYSFFSEKDFKNNIQPKNVFGVFLPYVLLEAECKGDFSGEGQYLIKTRQRGEDDYYYDYDCFDVDRVFECNIMNIQTVLNKEFIYDEVIESINPFDISNSVPFHTSYLDKKSAVQRNINLSEVDDDLKKKCEEVSTFALNDDLKQYEKRGVRWDKKDFSIVNHKYSSCYLPVWIYSYKNERGTFFIVVNGRTGKTCGKIPTNRKRIFNMVCLLPSIIIAFIAFLFSLNSYSNSITSTGHNISFIYGIATIFITWAVVFVVQCNISAPMQINRYENPHNDYSIKEDTVNYLTVISRSDKFSHTVEKDTKSQIENRNDLK